MPRRRGLSLFAIATIVLASAHLREPAVGASEWRQICEAAKDFGAPTADQPSDDETRSPSSLRDCSSVELYFGFERPPDPVGARKCAYLEMTRGDNRGVSGAAILTMIYANGNGARRDLNLAIKFACMIDAAEAETEFRVRHLASLKQQGGAEGPFSVCDDITSGYMDGVCAAIAQRFEQLRRQDRLADVVRRWAPAEKRAFERLRSSFDAFVQARVSNEVDLSGTSRAAFQVEEEEALREGFLTAIRRYEAGSVVSESKVEFEALDAELNRVYRLIQGDAGFQQGTVTREGIKETQRTWLKYREAWVTFGELKYPRVFAVAWKAWLTKERVAMLRDFLSDTQ